MRMKNQIKNLLTSSTRFSYKKDESSINVEAQEPQLQQDFILHEKRGHSYDEQTPERVIYAKGTGAYGTFTVTNDISKYTTAKLFDQVGNTTTVFTRFSQVGGNRESADTERDPRGFAVKFYTEDGNWDLVGSNTPVFFIKDPKKFGDFIRTQKRDPRTNCKCQTLMWDFWSSNPESLHQVLILMSDRGTPYGHRHMHGFGAHTYSMTNANDEHVWVKFHFITQQTIKNFTGIESNEMRRLDPDFAQADLVDAIDREDFPKWDLKIQVMTHQEANYFAYNPFDVTKVWPHSNFPLIDVGVMELNSIPDNYFADVDQSAFAPSNFVNGISFSPDKMLQGRLSSYPDAQRYRLGVNYEQLAVNRCPYEVSSYQGGATVRVNGNGNASSNNFPNNFDDIYIDPAYEQSPVPITDPRPTTADWYAPNGVGEDDHYTQPGLLYKKAMNPMARKNLVNNIVTAMSGISGEKKEEIINRQLSHFFQADEDLGSAVAAGLRINVNLNKDHD